MDLLILAQWSVSQMSWSGWHREMNALAVAIQDRIPFQQYEDYQRGPLDPIE